MAPLVSGPRPPEVHHHILFRVEDDLVLVCPTLHDFCHALKSPAVGLVVGRYYHEVVVVDVAKRVALGVNVVEVASPIKHVEEPRDEQEE